MKLAEFLASGKQIHAGDVLESKNGGRLKVTRHSEWMWNDPLPTDEGFKVISAKELEEAPVTDTNTEWKNGDIAYLDLQVVRFIGIDPCDVDYCYVTYASHYASHFMRRVLTSELSKTKPLTQEEKDEKNGEKLFSLHQGFASNYDGYPATTWMNASPCTKGSFTELAKKVDFEGKL